MFARLLILILFFATACDFYKNNRFQEYYVVEAYLIADSQLPPVRLSKTATMEDDFNFTDMAIDNATVEIRKLSPDSSISERYPYEQYRTGMYRPVQLDTVNGETLYQLHVTLSDGETIESKTFVPAAFSTVTPPKPEYLYQQKDEVTMTITPSFYPGRQTYYQYSVNIAEPDTQRLTPFYRDQIINGDNHWGKYFVHSSDIINEKSRPVDENGNIIFTIPWQSFAFYGENNIVINALDDNMYNFLRTQQTQNGSNRLAPGEIQNIRYNINGGIGIFGSIANDTNQVFIRRP